MALPGRVRRSAVRIHRELKETMVVLASKWWAESTYITQDASAPILPIVAKYGGSFKGTVNRLVGFIYVLDGYTFQVAITPKSYTWRRIA